MGSGAASPYPPNVDGRRRVKQPYELELARREARETRRRDWKRNFLRAYVEFGTVRKACEVAGITRAIYQQARRDDPQFNEAVEYAWQDGTDRVVETVWEWAVEGVRDPIVWQGEIIGYRVVKDVKAAKWLAEVRDPGTYSQRERIARMGVMQAEQVRARQEQMLEAAEKRIKQFAGHAQIELPETVDAELDDDGDDDAND